MKDRSKPGSGGSSERPRSPRVPVSFSVVVEGETANGEPFKSKASAIKVSRAGATIVIDEEVALGARVVLAPPFGGRFEAEVNGAWIDESDGRWHIGVKLVGADGWFEKQE